MTSDLAADLGASVSRRWQGLDPLLPAPTAPRACCDAGLLVVSGPGGHPVAAGGCEHWDGQPGSLDLSWGAARQFKLTAQVAGPDVGAGLDVAAGLDGLLTAWRGHLAGQPGAGGDDTAAVVMWPSRDVDGIRVLRRRGLTAMSVVAARPRGRPLSPGATAGPGLRIRRAGPADLDVVTRLGLGVIQFDGRLGCVTERADSAEALRRELEAPLAGPQPWTWLAEQDGAPVGMLYAQRPADTGWIAPLVGPAPVAYLMLMYVRPGVRGSGVGTALTARLHAEADAAGVAVTLLHYEQANPLSVPFWSQMGYRPAWTTWEAWPATALR